MGIAEAVPGGESCLGWVPVEPEVSWSGGSSLDQIVALLGRSLTGPEST